MAGHFNETDAEYSDRIATIQQSVKAPEPGASEAAWDNYYFRAEQSIEAAREARFCRD